MWCLLACFVVVRVLASLSEFILGRGTVIQMDVCAFLMQMGAPGLGLPQQRAMAMGESVSHMAQSMDGLTRRRMGTYSLGEIPPG